MGEDWIEVPYKDVVDKIPTSKQKVKQKEYLAIGEIPVVDQGQETIGGYYDDKTKIIDCRLPIIVFGDHTKAVKLINFKFIPGADGTKVLQPKKFIDPKLLTFFTKVLVHKISDKGYARHYQHIEKLSIPIPPFPEQRAIVAKIEQLFSELDNGIANLKKAQVQLKRYRQAVLKEAFEGNFEIIVLKRCSEITGGVTKGKKLAGQTTVSRPYLRVANVQDGYLDLRLVKEIGVTIFDSEKYKLEFEDVLFTEGGDKDKLGRGTVWKNEINNCIHQNHIFRARVDKNILNPYYLSYYAGSPEGKDYFFTHGKQTTNLASINKTILSNLPLPLPTVREQEKIVTDIEVQITNLGRLEKIILENLSKAEALRQSILKQSFDGKLLSEREIAACRKIRLGASGEFAGANELIEIITPKIEESCV